MWKLVPALIIQHIMPCMNSTEPLEIYMLPGQMEEEAWPEPPAHPIGLKVEEAMTSAEINAELVCLLRTPNFPPGTHDYDPKRHDFFEGVSRYMISGQEPRLSSISFVKHKDHMMKSTLMAPKWTREWGQRRWSIAISRMVRQPAANCPKDCQTTAPSLQLRLQPSVWHRTITNTWAQSITMW